MAGEEHGRGGRSVFTAARVTRGFNAAPQWAEESYGGGCARGPDGNGERGGVHFDPALLWTFQPEQPLSFAVHPLNPGVRDAITACTARREGCALLSAHGGVLRLSGYGHLRLREAVDRPLLARLRLPWPAAAVSCGANHCVALRRGGGAVCGWDWDHADPREVRGLPPADPVALLSAGQGSVIAVTEGDEAYGWGSNAHGELAIGPRGISPWPVPAPVRIAALSGCGLRRLACGCLRAVAETRCGTLLGWGYIRGRTEPLPVRLRPAAGRIAGPLNGLAAGLVVAAVDSAGQLWCLWDSEEHFMRVALTSALHPTRGAPCATVCVARLDVVALAADGHLWHCGRGAPGRCITAAYPQLPLGLLPCGGSAASHAVLVPDPSCGPARCRLLLLAAGRLDLLPGGHMRRLALVPFLVFEDFIFGEQL
eukprot:TRINITY_DN12385_c0_g1_i1.p1 TRINITY_DN12385_c0_g1~~TRINITY_DN12385_c0_g1_i1.p1  ORF type:complete len:455 (+),score=81.57 TRINITY_DN12385_c0_g1_i1:91-1365(+)